ncbi:hypothetical protein ACRQ4B_14555 [Curtobacterium sp. SP.BCo]|uniref:GHMP family kinase ATP-binding protein n=1 Tax=Curtobacterium sp. SP.BCo TaxID=3435229 RepID=UPI003F742000
MIIARSPLRVSFFGGGSDLPAYFSEQPGCVVSTTIDLAVETVLRPRARGGVRVVTDGVQTADVPSGIEHDFVREALLNDDPRTPLDVSIHSDVRSSGTGLGTSGAVVTSLVAALAALRGVELDPAELAATASEIEMVRCGRSVGLQDQTASAHGGLRRYDFGTDGTTSTTRVDMPAAAHSELQASLVLVDTLIGRDAGTQLSHQSRTIARPGGSRARVTRMVEMARAMHDELVAGRIDSFGAALHEAWTLKAQVLGATASPVVDLYEHGRRLGATGGKLLGAGGGGHMLFVVPPERRAGFVEDVGAHRVVPFRFSEEGTRVRVA